MSLHLVYPQISSTDVDDFTCNIILSLVTQLSYLPQEWPSEMLARGLPGQDGPLPLGEIPARAGMMGPDHGRMAGA